VTATARAEEAVRAADRGGTTAERAQAHNMAARACLLREDIEGASKHLDVACAEAERAGDVVLLAVAAGDRADLRARAGLVGPALDEVTDIADRLRAAGRLHPHALIMDSVAGALQRRLGHGAEARRIAEAILAGARSPATRAAGHLLTGLCDLDEGALGDARERLELARFGSATLLVGGIAGPLALGRAELALVEGRFDDARGALDEGIGQIERTADEELLAHLGLLGLRLVAERERHAGTRVSARLLARGRRDIARYEGHLDRVLDGPGRRRPELTAAWRAERHRDDPERWDESARAWAAAAWPRAAATARLRAAEARLARPDERAAGARALAGIRAAAEADGWRLLVDQVDGVARRAGVVPAGEGAPVRVPAGRLTRRERAVLDLVAAGATNRQIAAALYISPKTASVHVSRILTKLGAATRQEAVAVTRRLA
jgi:DNA-binding CsgD family transcriptional regulator